MGKSETVFLALNQKIVTIEKYKPETHRASADPLDRKPENYTKTARLSMDNAARRMNGKRAAGFQLWALLQLNADGYRFTLSNKCFSERWGISKHTYDSGIKILIDEGFLKQRSSHEYDFIEYPPEHRKQKTEQTKVRKPDKQKCGNETLKSAETAQANIICDITTDIINDITTGGGDNTITEGREGTPPPPPSYTDNDIRELAKAVRGMGIIIDPDKENEFFSEALKKTKGDRNRIMEVCCFQTVQSSKDPGGELMRCL